MNIEIKTKIEEIKLQDRIDVSVLLVRILNEKVQSLEKKVKYLEGELTEKTKSLERVDTLLVSRGDFYKCYNCDVWFRERDTLVCNECDDILCMECSENGRNHQGAFTCQNCLENI